MGLLSSFLMLITACSGKPVTPAPVIFAPVTSASETTPLSVHAESIPHPNDPKKRIEFFWTRPEGGGPWPALVYIHGHQEPARPGGKDLVGAGVLQRAAKMEIRPA